VDPIEALNEIAFWLERSLDSPYRTKAFRGAAAALVGMPSAQVAQSARTGALRRVPGIGDTSATVIREAVDGGIPSYLADLREKALVPLVGGGEKLRAQLRGDLHSHSDWSDGTTSIDLMAATAASLGHEYLVLTDHSPRLTVANGLSPERLTQQLIEVARVNESRDDTGFALMAGIEVDILDDGQLDQVPELLDRLDVVVASVHSKLRMERADMTRRMLAAVANPHTNVLGHCTGQLVKGGRGTRPPSRFDADAVFAACAEYGVAVEINSRPERADPPDELIAIALDAGCLFSIDSDAHAPGHLAFLDYGAQRATANGVPADRIVSTWPAERLREWAAG